MYCYFVEYRSTSRFLSEVMCLTLRQPPTISRTDLLLPCSTLVRTPGADRAGVLARCGEITRDAHQRVGRYLEDRVDARQDARAAALDPQDRKSTRLNSSH